MSVSAPVRPHGRPGRRSVPNGSVTGIDIAPSMIAAARQRTPAAEIEWIVGDAASHDLAPGSYDAVISRFGVMFFADPVAAFDNLRQATRIGARLVVTVWSHLFASGFFSIPYTVVTTTLHRLGMQHQDFPQDGILFSLGRPGLARTVLEAAGWADVETRVDNRNLYLPPDPRAAAKETMAAGPVQVLLEGQSEAVRAEVEETLVADYDIVVTNPESGSRQVSLWFRPPPVADQVPKDSDREIPDLTLRSGSVHPKQVSAASRPPNEKAAAVCNPGRSAVRRRRVRGRLLGGSGGHGLRRGVCGTWGMFRVDTRVDRRSPRRGTFLRPLSAMS